MASADRTIVIVGGVAGGASAATRARRMNERAEIILFEKDADVSFANCGLPYYIGDEIKDRGKLLVATADLLRRRFRLDVRPRQEVIGINRERKVVDVVNHETGESYQQHYDKLILAPGASPIVPSIPGANATNVLALRNLNDTDRIRSVVDRYGSAGATTGELPRAVVVGAGFIGLEMVEQLARRGWHVTLVEMEPQVLPPLDPEMAAPLEDELRRNGVQLYLSDPIKAIETDSTGAVQSEEQASGTKVQARLVLMSIGVRPNLQLAESAGLQIGPGGGIATNEYQQSSDADIYAVGDAVDYVFGPTGNPRRVPLAGPANRAGRIAGEHAATDHSATMAPVQGTAILRFFDQTAGLTGLTDKLAERLKVAARSVTVVANHHAGYYPGAQRLLVKLSYCPDSGRVLGAQVVGGAGVDKRLDIIATAMAFRGTVRDLAGLDLAYAPPFGSAKDPVHMAAFAACNQLDGVTDCVAPCADLADKQVVDVRTAQEVARTPLAEAPHAINIPVDELRDRLLELDPQANTVVSCAVGVRGHVATRILRQNGFRNVVNLTGGATLRNLAKKD